MNHDVHSRQSSGLTHRWCKILVVGWLVWCLTSLIPTVQAQNGNNNVPQSGGISGGSSGPNLLLNPTFELGTSSPTHWADRRTSQTDTSTARTGSKSLGATPPVDAFNYTYQNVNVTPGQTYTLAGWIKTSNVAGQAQYGAYLRFVKITPNGVTFDTAKVTGTQEWRYVSKTFTIPADTLTTRVDLMFHMTQGQAWFDDVALCLGTSCPITSAAAIATPTATPPPTPAPSPTPLPSFTATRVPTVVPTVDGLVESVDLATPIVNQAIAQVASTATSVAQDNGAKLAVPVAAATLLVPSAAVIIPALPFISLWHIPGMFLGLLRRKRSPWGVVYDSYTKETLDPAVVTLTNKAGKQWQTVTDIYGRYEFLIEPGEYTLYVNKSNYIFPDPNAPNPDSIYDQTYVGQPITINQDDHIGYNIPMSLVQTDWNQAEKLRRHIHLNSGHLSRLLNVLSYLGVVGLAWSIAMVLLAPTPVNLAVCGLYVLMYLGIALHHHRHPWGKVVDELHRPVAGAVVRLTSPDLPINKQPPLVTRKSGRYSFLVQQGRYQLHVHTKDMNGNLQEVAVSQIIDVTKPYDHIHQNITINTQAQAE